MSKDKERHKKLEFTVFQAGSSFRGILKFSRPLRILGKFEGEISGDGIIEIGQGAQVEAHIRAAEIVVFGHVTGNIAATERVELHSGATLIGNIRAPSLEIDDGVVFEGQCEMKNPESHQKQEAIA